VTTARRPASSTLHKPDSRTEARAARADLELALDAQGWPWRRSLSLWVDSLLLIEESKT
jgi:hypothetical protein